jgi:hypothetical protein
LRVISIYDFARRKLKILFSKRVYALQPWPEDNPIKQQKVLGVCQGQILENFLRKIHEVAVTFSCFYEASIHRK